MFMGRIQTTTIFLFNFCKLIIINLKTYYLFMNQIFPLINQPYFLFSHQLPYLFIPYSQDSTFILSSQVQNQIINDRQDKIECQTSKNNSENNQSQLEELEKTNVTQIIVKIQQLQKQCDKSQKNNQKKKKQSQKEHFQKYGRNICSNIFHIVIKKILYEKQYNELITKIITQYNMEITIEQFFNKLYFKQNKLNQYVPFDKIIQFYLGQKNKIKEGLKRHLQFCKILRIVSQYYLKNDHAANIFVCPKLRKDSKHCHIKESRKLFSIVRGTYHQDYKQPKK